MTETRPEITPTMTIHALLEAYPELEERLIEIAPPFKKLKNPVLRRSVAKIATLRQVSAVGRIPLEDLINKLRSMAGQPELNQEFAEQEYFGDRPDWFGPEKIVETINESQLEEADQMTLVPLMAAIKRAEPGEIVELNTSFLPVPGIDLMKSKGYSVWTHKESEDMIKTYFLK